MLSKELNKRQEPLLWSGLVFAGVFFLDVAVRMALGKGLDLVFSALLALMLALGYFLFAVLNNRRLAMIGELPAKHAKHKKRVK
jgi:hypothetical protein